MVLATRPTELRLPSKPNPDSRRRPSSLTLVDRPPTRLLPQNPNQLRHQLRPILLSHLPILLSHLLDRSPRRQHRNQTLFLSLEILLPKLRLKVPARPPALLALQKAVQLSARVHLETRPANPTSDRQQNRRRSPTLQAQTPEPIVEPDPTSVLLLRLADLRHFRRTYRANDSSKAFRLRR